MTNPETSGWLHRLRERGVIRVAASYAVIAWLLLQIADVTFGPLGVPGWVMVSLIVAAVLGFPVAVALAWFYEAGSSGVTRDTAARAFRARSYPACVVTPTSRSSPCSWRPSPCCWCGSRTSVHPGRGAWRLPCCHSRT